ncbi:thiol-disulfide oxidoreductase DCC family protein [Pontibacter sp. G13]|uniref:thiol-disulfide oxidoreductase DCC family protein n=1 Tax=Pontibacter sp. G13 TaxID=3074898 RepID=UPI002889F704|nr:thiol-disulfide oxidoreductase DCC family protein [Pontibacter sp. G13]WNJ19857.1 thiol-disulfide oxidoreductase DCC family protein [Pontibacter sp. G13]
METPHQTAHNHVVFFDGVCNLCNSTVDFLIRRDQDHTLRFAANQSDFAQKILREELGNLDSETIYYWEDGKLYDRSDAVFRIFRQLGAPWSWMFALRFVPRGIRDGVYRWIAKNRYRWFGKKETCRLPTPEERAQFIA